MTEVDFHTGVADPAGFACRLLRKALRLGARVAVHADAPQLQALDALLWSFEPTEFLPHLRCTLPPAPAQREMAARTPLWLLDALPSTSPAPAGTPPVLLCLQWAGAALPAAPGAFARVVEVVGAEPDELAAARLRFRRWREAGCSVRHHAAGG